MFCQIQRERRVSDDLKNGGISHFGESITQSATLIGMIEVRLLYVWEWKELWPGIEYASYAIDLREGNTYFDTLRGESQRD